MKVKKVNRNSLAEALEFIKKYKLENPDKPISIKPTHVIIEDEGIKSTYDGKDMFNYGVDKV